MRETLFPVAPISDLRYRVTSRFVRQTVDAPTNDPAYDEESERDEEAYSNERNFDREPPCMCKCSSERWGS